MVQIKHLLCLLLALMMMACSDPPVDPLRIVSSPWPGYEPLYLARDLGYLDENSVRITEMPSSNITWETFNNGSADIATLTLDEVLSLVDAGRKLRILVVMDISHGGDVVMARPEITALAGLKGKRIGMVNIPLGVFMLNRVLELAGLNVDDVTVIQLAEDKHLKAYLNQEIDAAITFDPHKTHLIRAGAHTLFDSSQIPNEIFDLLVSREDVYQARYDELCDVARQWYRTLDYIAANPEKAHAHMGKRLNVSSDEFRIMLDGIKIPARAENKRLLNRNSPEILPPARRLAAIMLKEKLLTAQVDPIETFDPAFQGCID